MVKTFQKRKESGFTIIEVLIVLAIAGLILLVVFLAVPALQRNSRNTTIKNDVANVLGGVSEYSAANNGALPDSVAGTGTVTYKLTAGGDNQTTSKIQSTTAVSTITSLPAAVPTAGTIQVYLKFKCATDTTVTANSRATAVFYSIETASGSVQKCQDS